jgi:uncharacterized protein
MKKTVLLLFALFFLLGFFAASLVFLAPQNAAEKPSLQRGGFSSEINIVAVSGGGEKGVTSKARAEIIDGQGRVLFNLNPFVEPDTQFSVETAVKVAENYTGFSLSNKDVIFEIKESPARLVGGPSDGAELAIVTTAAIKGKRVRGDAAITGTINANGTIGQVSGIIEKAAAASENGLKLFVIPKGQTRLVYYERQDMEERMGPFVIIRTNFVPRELDLREFAEKELKIEIKEAANIQEAAELLIE